MLSGLLSSRETVKNNLKHLDSLRTTWILGFAGSLTIEGSSQLRAKYMQIPFLYQGKVMLRAGRYIKSLWRNWLARSAVNRKVDGSSPSRDAFLNIFPACKTKNAKILKQFKNFSFHILVCVSSTKS